MPRSSPAPMLAGMNGTLAATGLYSSKSWYAGLLTPVRNRLVAVIL
jgi:hypothetical protein